MKNDKKGRKKGSDIICEHQYLQIEKGKIF
jgi:hypothetical protein